MKSLPEMTIAPAIQQRLDILAAAKIELAKTLASIQADCEHRFVSERPYHSGHFGKIANAHRICLRCRFIEEGSHWSGGSSWSRADSALAKPVLGNVEGRVVLTISNDEFYKLRISA